jgi:amino acid transporter
MSTTPDKAQSGTRLRSNSMGWIAAAALGAIIMSPAGGIYFNFGPMASVVGKAVPFVFIVAALVSLPTAASFAIVAREMPSAGSVYTWMRHSARPAVGLYVGWIVFGFYLLAAIVLPGVFALFFNEFLQFFGVHTGYWTWAAGVLLTTGVVVLIDFLGIGITVKATIIFMVFESTILLVLALSILFQGGSAHQVSFSSFSPAGLGSTAVFGALIFGIQSNVGYDAIATLAEETKEPRQSIPRATIAAVILVGCYWVVVSWGFSIAVPTKEIGSLMQQGFTPITPIAKRYWGNWSLLITISAMTSITGIYLAQAVGSSRVIFAMGRDGGLPSYFSRLKEKYQLPWRAMTFVIVLTSIVTLALGKGLGLATQYNWTGTMSSALGLLTYICVNLANIVYFRKYRREQSNWFLNGVLPGIGLLVCVYVLYKSYGSSLWQAGWTYGRSVQLAIVAWLVIGLVYAAIRARSSSATPAPPSVDMPVLTNETA